MAGVKISALPAGVMPVSGDFLVAVQGGQTVRIQAEQLREYVGEGLSNASSASVSAAYAADTYLAGSAIALPSVNIFRVGSMLRWTFDMVKTAAGVAAPAITVRAGTNGTIADAAIYTFTFGAGTAAADTGIFDVTIAFRSIGAGTSAVVAGFARLNHHGNGTGLTNLGGFVSIVVPGPSAGFNSQTPSFIGLSFNGGASFSGTNTFVSADADKI